MQRSTKWASCCAVSDVGMKVFDLLSHCRFALHYHFQSFLRIWNTLKTCERRPAEHHSVTADGNTSQVLERTLSPSTALTHLGGCGRPDGRRSWCNEVENWGVSWKTWCSVDIQGRQNNLLQGVFAVFILLEYKVLAYKRAAPALQYTLLCIHY